MTQNGFWLLYALAPACTHIDIIYDTNKECHKPGVGIHIHEISFLKGFFSGRGDTCHI